MADFPQLLKNPQGQGELNHVLVDTDLTELVPKLLDQMIALGEIAKQVSQTLGGNGHREEAVRELASMLSKK